MNRTVLIGAILSASLFILCAPVYGQRPDDAELAKARRARDRAAVPDLQRAVAAAKKNAVTANNAQSHIRVALLVSWLCEALESSQKMTLFKQAAEEGVTAAEKAVELDPRSSEAHQLLGDLLNQLIPHVFGGGMRYGKRATDAMYKAIELDPRNVHAYVSRAISYYYTPDSFGGGKIKAIQMLKKALQIKPDEDTPHIWLALFYLDAGQTDDALREISKARTLNPDRVFSHYVYKQVVAARKPAPRPQKSNSPRTK